MTVGQEPCQADLFKGSGFVGERLAAESVFAVLEREGRRLCPEGMFDDLFSSRGRRSVPPRVVATVMVLQRWFGLSDREAVAAFEFDLRWRFACGGLDVDGGGFCHTVLVGMRARLAASGQPRRIFDAARSAGALSQRRVLDSVPKGAPVCLEASADRACRGSFPRMTIGPSCMPLYPVICLRDYFGTTMA